MEDTNYLMIMSTQSYWNLRINSVNPCGRHVASPPIQSENCALVDPTPVIPLPHFPLESGPEALRGVQAFCAWAALFSWPLQWALLRSQLQVGHTAWVQQNFTAYWAPNLHILLNICHWLSHKHTELNMSKTEFSNWAIQWIGGKGSGMKTTWVEMALPLY